VAEKFDAASRLAEGRPAVDEIQNCVWACHLLGYQNPDLTLHAAQVRDWYGSEDGLNLRALDNDCAALDAAVSATSDALARQDDQLAAVSAAWQGPGADASREFLRRHHDASAAAAAAVRSAADALAGLRDDLWQVVDGKVATTMAVGQRAQAEWLAAAQTVATGAGDRATASELIDQQVRPFVDNDIRADWLTAMRAATAAVMDLYDAATTELTAEGDAVFDVPGDLGPSWAPPPRDDDVATTPAAASIPVASAPSWSVPSWPPPASPPPMPAAVEPPPAPIPPPVDPAATTPAMAAPPSMPSLGGLPDIGSGLSGLGQQLGDVFGSLLGNADDAFADPAGLDDPELDEPELDEDKEDDEAADDTDEEQASEDSVEEPVDDPAVDACPTADTPPPVEEPLATEPAPTPIPPPPEPALPPPEPAPIAAETPCEIAADELPQVGQ
jgi:uncharacterized protein YukE